VLGLIGSGQILSRAYFGMMHRDLTVASVVAGGPAERAGISVGDQILAVDEISAEDDFCRLRLRNAQAGDTLRLRLRASASRRATGDERAEGAERTVYLVGARPPTSEVIWRFAMSTAGLCSLALGFFLAWQRPDKLTLAFFGFCFSIAVFLREHPNIPSPFWQYVHESFYIFAQALLPAFLVHFFILFPERPSSRRRRMLERLVYFPAMLMIGWALLEHYLPTDRINPTLEPVLLVLGSLYIVSYIALAIALFVRSYRRVRTAGMRARLRVVVWGTVLGITPLFLGMLAVNLFPSRSLPGVHYSFLALALVPLSFAYAAFRHRVFDVEILVKRSVLYSTLSALLLAVYFGVVVGLGGVLHRLTGASNPLLVMVSILVIALIAAPARARLQRLVDRAFFRQRYDARATLRRFSHDLARMLELGGIATLLVQRVAELLEVERVALLLREEDGQDFKLYRSIPESAAESESSDAEDAAGNDVPAAVERLFADGTRPLQLDGRSGSVLLARLPLPDRKALWAYRPSVLVPLRAREFLLGILALGPRRGIGWTSQEDLEILETLGEQAAITIQNSLLHRQALEKERMAQELSVAQGVQAQLVPESDPSTSTMEFASFTIACHEIGGDFYDYVPLPDRKLGVAIGDVSGKGIPAALLMAGLQSSFRSEAERGLHPADVLRALNLRILALGDANRFVCFFYGVLDLERRQMTYANAGIDPPVVVRGSGRVERLMRGGPVLGVMTEPRYPEGKVSLNTGDTLLMFTDGVVEPIEKRTGLGEADLVRFLVSHRDTSASNLRQLILDRLREILGPEPEDDTTLIVAKTL
jgi:sigma-B regulation protein RsbU (phosphoserine phosphatase)